jgi:membrane associated rhomboid family serine protease
MAEAPRNRHRENYRRQAEHFATVSSSKGEWLDLLDVLSSTLGRGRPGTKKLREWELVLTARSVPHVFRRSPFKSRILVPADEAERAAEEISAYETENAGNPLQRPPLPHYPFDNRRDTALAFGLLLLFFSLTSGYAPFFGMEDLPWFPQGRIHSEKILNGEWWRCFTALTLHADAGHVLSNTLIGGVFTGILCMRIGGGPGWLLFILGGGLGNFINASAHGPGHFAVGASTGVFAVVGSLTSLQVLKQRRIDASALVPAACGLAFLAFLGVGGEGTDLGAHVFGFLAGAILGIPAGLLIDRYGVLNSKWNKTCAGLVLAFLSISWLFAFFHTS